MSRALLVERAVGVVANDREAAGRDARHLRIWQRHPAFVFVRGKFGVVRELVAAVGRLGWNARGAA